MVVDTHDYLSKTKERMLIEKTIYTMKGNLHDFEQNWEQLIQALAEHDIEII